MADNAPGIAQHAHLLGSKKHVKKAHLGTAQLTYYIFEGILTGFFADEFIHLTAWSGGAAGSVTRKARKAAPHTQDANNPYSTGVKEGAGVRGGPLPPGSYSIASPSIHPKLKLSARLDYQTAFKYRDGGFYIHGQGPKGSDGCIVIPDEHFHGIMEKLKKCHGGHLQVFEAMEDSAFA